MWVEMVCKVMGEHAEASDAIRAMDELQDRGLLLIAGTGHVRIRREDEGEEEGGNPCDAVPLSEMKDTLIRVCGGKPYIRVMEWEIGGGYPRSGDATCVSGLKGEPLRPLPVTADGDQVNGKHALFASKSGLVTAHVTRLQSQLTVRIVKHELDQESGGLTSEEVYSETWPDVRGGVKRPEEIGEFPIELDWAWPVVSAATRKAWRFHCTFPFYYHKEDERRSRW